MTRQWVGWIRRPGAMRSKGRCQIRTTRSSWRGACTADSEAEALREVEERRHRHALVRSEGDLTPAAVSQLWRGSCRGARVASYCRPVSRAGASARYLVKDLRDGSKKGVPPEHFGGRRFSSSKRSLARPLKALLRAVVVEWRTQAQMRSAHLGDR